MKKKRKGRGVKRQKGLNERAGSRVKNWKEEGRMDLVARKAKEKVVKGEDGDAGGGREQDGNN